MSSTKPQPTGPVLTIANILWDVVRDETGLDQLDFTTDLMAIGYDHITFAQFLRSLEERFPISFHQYSYRLNPTRIDELAVMIDYMIESRADNFVAGFGKAIKRDILKSAQRSEKTDGVYALVTEG